MDTQNAPSVFSDVGETDWYFDSVSAVSRLDLMRGTDYGTFSPKAAVTGTQAVTLLARLHASITDQDAILASMTAHISPWYQGYFDYCTKKKLITKEKAETLSQKPNDPITRAQLLALFAALPDTVWTEINFIPENAIPDVPSSYPDAAAIYRAYRAGITIGTDACGSFAPDSPISRAELAAMLVRIVDPDARLYTALDPTEVHLYAADGTVITVPVSEVSQYLIRGWKETPYPNGFSAKQLLNEAYLTPTETGYAPLDRMIDGIFSKLFTDSMNVYDKVTACYDYLIEAFTYGSSSAAGKYRAIYRNNPYLSPNPAQICPGTDALRGDRGYTYFLKALEAHALEAYAAMYAAEMLDGHIGWCDHFSCAFAVMMRRIGLMSFPIYVNSRLGNEYLPHMTVIVTVGGVDCIFDPQIEAVLVANTGKNAHKRFCRPLSEMTAEYRDFGDLEACRNLFGPFLYDPQKMPD